MQKDVNGKYAISTRLLILKQFIKQFGWCEGVIHDKDARGEGYRCEKLRKEISEYRDRLEAAGELFDAPGKEKMLFRSSRILLTSQSLTGSIITPEGV